MVMKIKKLVNKFKKTWKKMKVDAIKDGKGNIVISEDSFEMLLSYLDNQKYVGEGPINVDQDIQKSIDDFNKKCREILHQKYIFETREDGYFLAKRYQHQNELTKWEGDDVGKVYELFKDTEIKWEKPNDLLPLEGNEPIMKGTEPIGKTKDGWMVCEPEKRPWLIERPMRCDYNYLTISEDGKKNRLWKQEEIEKIGKLFNYGKIG